jgi:hypothetical protein
MPDPREWISRIKVVQPPELWEEVSVRATRSSLAADGAPRYGPAHLVPTTPRRAALVAGAVVGIPLLVVIMLVIATRTPDGGNRATPTPAVSPLADIHDLLERQLSDLWIAESNLAELRGELHAAEDELAALRDEIGSDPSDAELQEIETLQERIQTWTRGVLEDLAVVQGLRDRVEEIRLQRQRLLPPAEDADYPLVATVTCDGDGTGGTHVSTPVVRLQPDGVDLHVVNRISNEQVFLRTGPGDEVYPVPAGGTADITLPISGPSDMEIVCTYVRPDDFAWPRPTHPIWIAPVLPDAATVSPSPEPTQLDPVVLTASLDEAPVIWPEVAFIPAGGADSQIGVQPCYHCGEQLIPSALAIDPDGSFWIADSFKARIAHFARDGSLIEAFPAEIGSAVPDSSGSADLAFVGDRLYVLLEEGRSRVVPVESGGLGEPIFVNNEGQGLHVEAVIPGQDELTVMISGAERLLGGYWAFATVDPATGQTTPSPGVRGSTGSHVAFWPLLDTPPGDYQIQWFRDGHAIVAAQDVRFQLVRNGHEFRTTVGDAYVRTATGHGVATIVGMSNLLGSASGRWYLEIVPESPGIVFERIPEEGFIGDARRALTVGPDGGVYWMRLLEDGLHIYRR